MVFSQAASTTSQGNLLEMQFFSHTHAVRNQKLRGSTQQFHNSVLITFPDDSDACLNLRTTAMGGQLDLG